ncbi:MAG TPA: Ig-like domain repeat protein, partial [Candidatus Sulfotelmatobacter sp.]|nr:Ig-like domain repeat protein [Candidatus Sulfotelmatobacter sp.]
AIGLLDPAGLPYGLVQGNHDGAAGFDAHFPLADYTGKSWFGGSMPTKGFRDSYETFEVGNLKFLVLHLEYDGDASVIGWADGVIKANADRRVIMSTHDYATPGTPAAGRSPWGDATWTSLIAPNCNVFLVLNGHAAGEAARSDLNNCGQPVEQVVQDYQSRNGNGDGWLRYYTFRPSLDIVEAHTYKVPQAGNPGVFETDADSAFSFGYAMGGSGAFSLLGTISSASGTRASIDWPGLADGATFDWYASVSDGTTSTIGPTWSFSTVAGAPTTTVVTSSQNPSVYSEAVTFQADVTSGSGEPTGNVQFSIDGQPYEAPVALDHGTASVIASGLAIGHHIVSADYLGAGGFVPSTGDLAGGQEVAKAASAVTFDAIDPSTYGQPLTVSVNVDAALPDRGVMAPMLLSPLLLTATAPDQPTGTVQFSVDGVAVGDPVPLTDGYADQTVTDLSAGSHTIRAAYSGDDNYAGSDASETASVAKATQSITFTSSAPTGAVIGGSYAPTATASSGLTPDISLAPASAAICSLDLQGTVHFDAAGTCTIRADQAGDANHEAASQVHQDVTVGKKAQSIDFGPLGPGTFGDAPFSVSASASSSLDVAFASLTGSVCTVAGSTVTIVAAGTCTIRASQAGDATWAPATPVDQGFTVAKATQSITFPALPSHTYGDAPFDVTATATSGLVVTFSTTTPAVCGVTAGGRATIVGTGTCLITASQDGDGNWLPGTPVMQGFSVNRASARTTVTSSHNPSTYGDSVTFTATVTSSAGTPSGTVTFKEGSTILATVTLNGSGQATYTTSALSVGSHTISATYAASTDYAASTGAITQTVKKVKRR